MAVPTHHPHRGILDLAMYPHIRDAVLSQAPPSTWPSLRACSTEYRDLMEPKLYGHIALQVEPSTGALSLVSPLGSRLPGLQWGRTNPRAHVLTLSRLKHVQVLDTPHDHAHGSYVDWDPPDGFHGPAALFAALPTELQMLRIGTKGDWPTSLAGLGARAATTVVFRSPRLTPERPRPQRSTRSVANNALSSLAAGSNTLVTAITYHPDTAKSGALLRARLHIPLHDGASSISLRSMTLIFIPRRDDTLRPNELTRVPAWGLQPGAPPWANPGVGLLGQLILPPARYPHMVSYTFVGLDELDDVMLGLFPGDLPADRSRLDVIMDRLEAMYESMMEHDFIGQDAFFGPSRRRTGIDKGFFKLYSRAEYRAVVGAERYDLEVLPVGWRGETCRWI